MDEQDLLRKISALLNKAEGTDNENEASAFFDKAFDMMTRYAIDEARVREAREAISGRRIEDPMKEDFMFASYSHHAEAKADLLRAIAGHMHVRFGAYSNRKYSNDERVKAAGKTGLYESQWCWLAGYKTDIEAMKLLFISLLIQSQKFAQEDWKARYGNAKEAYEYDERYGYERPIGKFAWIGEHMNGFSSRIDLRFREMREMIRNEVADSNALMTNKDANILEWMYEQGFMRRPAPPSTTMTCYAVQPEDDPGWPKTSKGLPNRKHRAHYCYRPKWTQAGVLEDPTRVVDAHVDGNPAHTYTFDPGPNNYSYSVTIGRRSSSVGRSAGSSAANRADIGLTRVGNTARQIR